MIGKKILLFLVIFSLIAGVISPVQAQSLPWVEVWVTVVNGQSGAVMGDARVENTRCIGLPADACTRYGVWDAGRGAFILKVPRLEPYELVITRSGFETQMRSGTALDALMVMTIHLSPQIPGAVRRVFLPILIKGDNIPQPVYNPTAAVGRLNWWRSLAGVPAVGGNLEMHSGCRAHARWMVNWQTAAHSEDPTRPGYTIEGDSCGQASILAFGTGVYPTDEQTVDALLASPFHALAALNPRLAEVGFGSARLDMAWGGSYAGAALDVYRGVDWSSTPAGLLTFPRNGGTLPLLSYNGLAQPDPLTACPGYTAPTGAALTAMYLANPPGAIVSTTLKQGSTLLEHCMITAGNYQNSNAGLENQGRSILGEKAAVMIIPRQPLQPGRSYSVTLTYSSGQSVSWTFTTSSQPLNIVPMQVLLPHAD
jgi:hypothetical protein